AAAAASVALAAALIAAILGAFGLTLTTARLGVVLRTTVSGLAGIVRRVVIRIAAAVTIAVRRRVSRLRYRWGCRALRTRRPPAGNLAMRNTIDDEKTHGRGLLC